MLYWIRKLLFLKDHDLQLQVTRLNDYVERHVKDYKEVIKNSEKWREHFCQLANIKDYKWRFVDDTFYSMPAGEEYAKEGYVYSHTYEGKEYWVKPTKTKPKTKAKR